MIILLNAAQLVTYIGLLALMGQGLLHWLAGERRESNVVYQLFRVVNQPWLGLARRLMPGMPSRHHGWVALSLTAGLYAAATLAKIAHCLGTAMVGCR